MYNNALLGIYSSLLIVFLLAVLAWYILQVIAYWRIFAKAGEAGWKSIIPFYNTYIQYKLTWNPTWFFILIACCVITFVFGSGEGISFIISTVTSMAIAIIGIIANYKLSLAFGHGVGFAIGLVFLNPIFILILGFGSSEYQGPQ